LALQSISKGIFDDDAPGKFYVKLQTGEWGEQFASFVVGNQEMNLLVST
jgi:hypothetical protein